MVTDSVAIGIPTPPPPPYRPFSPPLMISLMVSVADVKHHHVSVLTYAKQHWSYSSVRHDNLMGFTLTSTRRLFFPSVIENTETLLSMNNIEICSVGNDWAAFTATRVLVELPCDHWLKYFDVIILYKCSSESRVQRTSPTPPALSQVVYFRNPSGGTWKNISERTSGKTRQ